MRNKTKKLLVAMLVTAMLVEGTCVPQVYATEANQEKAVEETEDTTEINAVTADESEDYSSDLKETENIESEEESSAENTSNGIKENPEEKTVEKGVLTEISTDNGKSKNYIVVTKDHPSMTNVKSEAEDKGLLAEEPQEILENNNVVIMDLSKKEALQVEKLKGVVSVEEDIIVSGCEEVPIDNEALDEVIENNIEVPFSRWNLDAIFYSENNKYKGKGINIAVLDSGVIISEDINLAGSVNLINRNETETNPLFNDVSGHGSGIAGIIGGSNSSDGIHGIAEESVIYPVKVLDANNQAPLSRIIEGLYWCKANGIQVINMSFATEGYSPALENAINEISDDGIIMVAAAGNRGNEASGPDYPAAFPNVISVGASNGDAEKTEFTNAGNGVDILAPGEKVWSNSVLSGFTPVSGTSIATAHVTAAVALILEAKPQADLEFIRQLIIATSIKAKNSAEGILNITDMLNNISSFSVSENVKPKIVPNVKTYDTSDIVCGCWDAAVHKGSVPEMTGYGSMMKAIGRMAEQMDYVFPVTGSDGNRYMGVFHGQHNYVADLHFLYYSARYARIYDTYDFMSASGRKNFFNSFTLQHDADTITGEEDVSKMINAIDLSLSGQAMAKHVEPKNQTLKSYIRDSWSAETEVSNKKLAFCMIMGMAVHLLGDTFAHRTMVPTTVADRAYNNESGRNCLDKKYFEGNWDLLIDKIAKGTIEFRDINMYAPNRDTRELYEDNSGTSSDSSTPTTSKFYPVRYTYTEECIKQMLYLAIIGVNGSGKFDPSYIFCQDVDFSLHLNNLLPYTISAGYKEGENPLSNPSMSTPQFRADLVNGKKHQPNEEDARDYNRHVYVNGEIVPIDIKDNAKYPDY